MLAGKYAKERTMNKETANLYLIALQLCSRVLQESPDEDFIKQIARDNMLAHLHTWDVFRQPGQETELPGYGALNAGEAAEKLAAMYSLQAVEERFEERADATDTKLWRRLYLQLHLDHMALFSGPSPLAAPWESVWRERDKLLFGEQTQKVLEFYRSWGISIENEGHEPEDHLGLELAFAAFLLQRFLADPQSLSTMGQSPLESLTVFLGEHILPWAGLCLSCVQEKAETAFYREFSVLIRVLLLNLRQDLSLN